MYCKNPFQRKPSLKQLWAKNMAETSMFGRPVKPGRRVERMTIIIGRHPREGILSQLNVPISSLKTLIIRFDQVTDSHFDWSLRSTRPAWLDSLQELDIRGVEFNNLYSLSNTGGSLPNLVILKCPILAAIQLIKYTYAPQLRKLTIVESDPEMSGADRSNFEDLIILLTNDDIVKWPELSCIALEFYPQWNTFLKMVTMYSRPRENQPETVLRSVELPAFPHPSILRSLVSALHGERVAMMNIPSISFGSRENEGCDFCRQSGWKCVYLTKGYCDRHSPYNLVSIIAETSIG
jgi:hypothetical protein